MVDAAYVAAARRRKMPVRVWTVNDEADMRADGEARGGRDHHRYARHRPPRHPGERLMNDELRGLRRSSLQPFFTPNGVAIIGASRDPSKLSYGVIRNLVDPEHGYPGPIYPVNPKAGEILGRRCYPDIAAVPDPVELAVLIIPADAVIPAIEACGRRGIKAAVVISGGFREVGAEGAAREREMVATARRYGMRVMGPNGIGVIDTHTPLNTTFVKGMPPKGSIAFLSQSGALCGGIIDWTVGHGIGFSRFLSVGNEADVNETDVHPVPGRGPRHQGDHALPGRCEGRAGFRECAAGCRSTQAGHCAEDRADGQRPGRDRVAHGRAGRGSRRVPGCVQAGRARSKSRAFRRCSMPHWPSRTSRCPAATGLRIVTNAGGPAALAADTLESAGLQLARTTRATQDILRPRRRRRRSAGRPGRSVGRRRRARVPGGHGRSARRPELRRRAGRARTTGAGQSRGSRRGVWSRSERSAWRQQAGGRLPDGRHQPRRGVRNRAPPPDPRVHLPRGCRARVRRAVAATAGRGAIRSAAHAAHADGC